MTGREYSHRLLVCDEFYRLIDRLHMKFMYDSNPVYETVFYCRKYWTGVRLLSGLEEPTGNPCSACGPKPQQVAVEFLWD